MKFSGNKSDEHDIAVVKTCDPFIQSPQVQPISFLPAHIGYPHGTRRYIVDSWLKLCPVWPDGYLKMLPN